jgi:hypothetical protein
MGGGGVSGAGRGRGGGGGAKDQEGMKGKPAGLLQARLGTARRRGAVCASCNNIHKASQVSVPPPHPLTRPLTRTWEACWRGWGPLAWVWSSTDATEPCLPLPACRDRRCTSAISRPACSAVTIQAGGIRRMARDVGGFSHWRESLKRLRKNAQFQNPLQSQTFLYTTPLSGQAPLSQTPPTIPKPPPARTAGGRRP